MTDNKSENSTHNQEEERQTLIEFPCEFHIKVMGLNSINLKDIVSRVVLKHSPHMKAPVQMKESLSANKKYVSVTATIDAQNQKQLDDIYRELHSHEATVMVF